MIAPVTVLGEKSEELTMLVALTRAIIGEPQAIENGYTIRAEIGILHLRCKTIVGSSPLHVIS